MKKFLLVMLMLCFAPCTFAEQFDYVRTYQNLEPADFSYIHNIDPDQYYDMQSYAYSPYPLLRLNGEVYFKNTKIEKGYYVLTPRMHKGKWYVLFKDNGKVKYIIPCYKHAIVEETFYEEHLPKEKLTFSQKVHIKFIQFFGHFATSKRKPAPKTYLELEDLDNDFLSMVVYYGYGKYYLIFRTVGFQ